MGSIGIDNLPDEVLKYIFSLISPYTDLISVGAVCKRWSYLVKETGEDTSSHWISSLKNGPLLWIPCVPPSTYDRTFITQRFVHSSCRFKNFLYIFGGLTSTSTAFNDLWRLDLGSREWCHPLAMGSYPSPKACATLVPYNESLVLFGGWTLLSSLRQEYKLFNDIHMYNVEQNRWTEIIFSYGPPPTAEHGATIHRNYMIVFGGTIQQELGLPGTSSNQVWCFDLSTYRWMTPIIENNMPHARYGHSQVHISDSQLLVIGGCAGANINFYDVWLLTIPDDISQPWHWTELRIHNPQYAPEETRCHRAVKVGKTVTILNKALASNNKNKCYTTHWHLVRRLRKGGPAYVPPYNPQARQNRNESNNNPHGSNDRCVNGLRGSLRQRHVNISSSSDESDNDKSKCSTNKPSIKPNASKNRERQLQGIKRMEERLQHLRGNSNASINKNKSHLLEKCAVCSRSKEETKAPLWVYTLDTSSISSGYVTWNEPHLPCCSGPEETVFYSLSVGDNELIMFGGIKKETNMSGSVIPEQTTNHTYSLAPIISVP